MPDTAEHKIISALQAHHRIQSGLCDALEEIADNLPHSVCRQFCLSVARRIYPVLRQAHKFEEETLFPYLLATAGHRQEMAGSLERQQYEHWADESYAEELSECLLEFGCGNNTELADKLAYMLRGFFEGVRRHLAFESEHLLPILQERVQTMKRSTA